MLRYFLGLFWNPNLDFFSFSHGIVSDTGMCRKKISCYCGILLHLWRWSELFKIWVKLIRYMKQPKTTWDKISASSLFSPTQCPIFKFNWDGMNCFQSITLITWHIRSRDLMTHSCNTKRFSTFKCWRITWVFYIFAEDFQKPEDSSYDIKDCKLN